MAAFMTMSTEGKERIIFAQLEALKEIRQKTLGLERLKGRLLQEVKAAENEEKNLGEFRQEMELLLQEKMAHVEELRQIHADINAMESVIKQAEDARNKAVEVARHLYNEYRSMKSDVDRTRRECLGLDVLPDFQEEEGNHIPPGLTMTANAIGSGGGLPSGVGGGFLPPPPPQAPLLLGGNASREAAGARNSLAPPPPGPSPAFRQQPPPMKSCMSCHQQIHRNAPICPLCKAKSRSRNPKKPKKKD
nr:EOG090X0H8R [Ilyocryptus agilis]